MTEIEIIECVWCGREFTTVHPTREKCGKCYLKTKSGGAKA